MSRLRSLAWLGAAASLFAAAACSRRSDSGPVIVSVIGGVATVDDPSRGPLDLPSRTLLAASAQGLVRFDAAGQIEPALAERWIVTDEGMSYIFRLRDAQWANGQPVTSAQAVRSLSRAVRRGSRNPMAPYLTAIDEIVEMTPEVIEIRLTRPRPDLLKLFADPALAVYRAHPFVGSGPFRIARLDGARADLRPVVDPDRDPDDEASQLKPEDDVTLIGERAAKAILRFADRRSDLVEGGTFTDWPLLSIADLPRDTVRLDPAAGLFGFAIVSRDGFLVDADNRAAIAAAIDRNAIVRSFAPGWAVADRILPDRLDSASAPAIASSPVVNPAQTVASWSISHPGPLSIRIALPAGPGANLLWGHVAANLIAIGITPQRVGANAPADLRLVDAVAPYDNARWYLANACVLCSSQTMAAIDAVRLAPTLAERARHIAEADRLLADEVAFIPIARPLRWSLVAGRLPQWQGNPRAWHPLNHLRSERE